MNDNDILEIESECSQCAQKEKRLSFRIFSWTVRSFKGLRVVMRRFGFLRNVGNKEEYKLRDKKQIIFLYIIINNH